jgi:hypothetical protein
MEELVRTNDPVLISFLESLMRDAGIVFLVADNSMSILDGSIGAIPRRFLVEQDKVDMARRIIADAGLEAELRDRKAP